MSSYYYLIAQLPGVSASAPVPFPYSYFSGLCSRFLSRRDMRVLDTVSLEPPRTPVKTGSVFLDRWFERERSLRAALAHIRAQRMKKKSDNIPDTDIPPDIAQIARTASGFDSPLEAERYLHGVRVASVSDLAPLDGFTLDALCAYALKLKLAERGGKFNEETGMASYRTIYDQILGEST